MSRLLLGATAMLACAVTGGCAVGAGSAAGGVGRDTTPPKLLLAEAAPAGSESPKPASAERSDATARAYGWISIAVGAEAAIVAVTTSFMLLHDKSVRDNNCDSAMRCSQAGIDANNAIRTLKWWNAGAWGVAALGLGVGAFLVLTNPPDGRSPSTAIGVAPNGSGLSLSARSTF